MTIQTLQFKYEQFAVACMRGPDTPISLARNMTVPEPISEESSHKCSQLESHSSIACCQQCFAMKQNISMSFSSDAIPNQSDEPSGIPPAQKGSCHISVHSEQTYELHLRVTPARHLQSFFCCLVFHPQQSRMHPQNGGQN